MPEQFIVLLFLTMDQFLTAACTGVLSATSERKELDNAWLAHVEIIQTLGSDEMSVKCVLTRGGSRSERLTHACRECSSEVLSQILC